MACTRKSRPPHLRSISAKAASMLAPSVTSHGITISLPTDVASGRTRFSYASPWKVKASLAPALWHALEMAQAIDRSLAIPMPKPFFPAISCPDAVMRRSRRGSSLGDKVMVERSLGAGSQGQDGIGHFLDRADFRDDIDRDGNLEPILEFHDDVHDRERID